jgi:ERCC4-type nuclease
MIIIDDREHELIKLFEAENIIHNKKRLDVGDFHLCDANGEIKIIIERKTINDYIYSKIVDKHLYDQIDNMLEIKKNNPDIIIVVLIENYEKYEGEKHGMTFEKFEISLDHLFCRGFNIIKTLNKNKTMQWINNLSKRMIFDTTNKGITGGYKKKKKTKFDTYLAQLCMLPGVSKNIAIEISKVCPSMVSLIEKLKDENGISGIKCGKKKISKKKSEEIKALLS